MSLENFCAEINSECPFLKSDGNIANSSDIDQTMTRQRPIRRPTYYYHRPYYPYYNRPFFPYYPYYPYYPHYPHYPYYQHNHSHSNMDYDYYD